MAERTYKWILTARQERGTLWLSWTTDAPFRAQQGQISVYDGSSFPSNAQDKRRAWSWDNENNRNWNTGLPWGSDWYCAWIAQMSPNGPYSYVVQLVTTGQSTPESVTSE